MIHYPYVKLAARLTDARDWASGVTEGNRCAFVVGVALNLKPPSESKSFRNVADVAPAVSNQPFLGKFYVKARDLADHIARVFGPPDIAVSGQTALSSIGAKRGVLFLDHCWGAVSLLGIHLREANYDHIDLWDGNCLEIYKGKKAIAAIHTFVSQSRSIRFWTVNTK